MHINQCVCRGTWAWVIVVSVLWSAFISWWGHFFLALVLTSLFHPRPLPSSCCPLSMRCPWPCLKWGCTHTWAGAPSEWCPRYGPFRMHLRDLYTQLFCVHITVVTARTCLLKQVQIWVVYLQKQCRIHWGHTWQRSLGGHVQCKCLR